MRKWVLLVFALVIVTISFYFVIPALTPSGYSTASDCTSTAAMRQIIRQQNWQWWPGHKTGENIYEFENCKYIVQKVLLNGIRFDIVTETDTLNGFLQFEPYGKDSTLFSWHPGYTFTKNPFGRIAAYFDIKRMDRSVKKLIDSMQRYFNLQKNVYGMNIVEQKITDSSLISMKTGYDHYPSSEEIYAMIDSLKHYISIKNGEEKNYPMLNVRKTGEEQYEAMVGVPTKWDLPAEGPFHLKKMVLGNVLMGEIRGGPGTIRQAERNLAFYVTDYRMTSPAIPFQSLVTNRLLEPDTSKWITRLYYPVF